MADLIDRDAMLEILCFGCTKDSGGICRNEYGRCAEYTIIKMMQTIEAEPVRHGRWVNDVFCSECNRFPVDVSVSISNKELTKYFSRCPHCGAKMDRGTVQ